MSKNKNRPATPKQIGYLKSLLTDLPQKDQEEYKRQIAQGITVREASELIDEIKLNGASLSDLIEDDYDY